MHYIYICSGEGVPQESAKEFKGGGGTKIDEIEHT